MQCNSAALPTVKVRSVFSDLSHRSPSSYKLCTVRPIECDVLFVAVVAVRCCETTVVILSRAGVAPGARAVLACDTPRLGPAAGAAPRQRAPRGLAAAQPQLERAAGTLYVVRHVAGSILYATWHSVCCARHGQLAHGSSEGLAAGAPVSAVEAHYTYAYGSVGRTGCLPAAILEATLRPR